MNNIKLTPNELFDATCRLREKENITEEIAKKIRENLLSINECIKITGNAKLLINEIRISEGIQLLNKVIWFRGELHHILSQKIHNTEKNVNKEILIQWWWIDEIDKKTIITAA